MYLIIYLLIFTTLSTWAKIVSRPDVVVGVTIDSIENLSDIVTSLKKLPVRITARVVFDEYVPATDYLDAVTKIHEVSDVMGELLDSYEVKNYSAKAYKDRTAEYLDLLKNHVDIWEIGNEINGEWLGAPSAVATKMISAYELVKGRGKKTALTLYYNEGCWEKKENEMFAWAEKNVTAKMKQGLDYVWLSYYEDDCNGLQPDWNRVFKKLGKMFPNSKLGFGEVGTKLKDRKSAYVKRYYRLKVNHPRFVGGYFWWYFNQDMVPATKPLWKTLHSTIQ